MALGYHPSNNFLPLLGLLRLLRIRRMYSLQRSVEENVGPWLALTAVGLAAGVATLCMDLTVRPSRCFASLQISISHSWGVAFKLVVLLMITAHLEACGFWYMASIDSFGPGSWAHNAGVVDRVRPRLAAAVGRRKSMGQGAGRRACTALAEWCCPGPAVATSDHVWPGIH